MRSTRGSEDRPSRANRPSRKNRPSRRRCIGFLAVDGEAVNVGKDHRYVMLCASDHSHAFDSKGLSTVECLEFLLDVKSRNPKLRMAAFGWNYDVNMMLRDLPFSELQKLWEVGSLITTLENGITYRLEWIPGKSFAVCRYGQWQYARVSDSFGFFQTSFVKALEAWNIPDPGGHIERMKGERSNFKLKDKDKILAYCIAECELLVELMNRLEVALDTADLRPGNWVGAGSVAGRMLRKHGIAMYRIADKVFGESIEEAIKCAYFGGRTEVFIQGLSRNVVNYDLVSAYPSEALHCPTLRGGRWREEEHYCPKERYAVWLVRWNVPGSNSVMPFPLRKAGSIYYPENGMGWYHSKEVKAALAIYPDKIEVMKGYVFTPPNDDCPFAFIREAFEARREAKKAGHASEKAFKLGLNAIYGKLAQGFGYGGKIPPFQSFYWAGMITAGTRARLLDLASLNLHGVVSMATDGIVFTGDPELTESKELGGLERTGYQEIFIAQPGVYRAVTEEGKPLIRSRGFFTKEIDFDDLECGWMEMGPQYTQRRSSTRFVGLGAALMRGDQDAWRTWATSDRTISLYSSRKFYDPILLKGRVMRLLPPRMPDDVMSEIYKPKGRGLDIAIEPNDYVEGLEQPMEDF